MGRLIRNGSVSPLATKRGDNFRYRWWRRMEASFLK